MDKLRINCGKCLDSNEIDIDILYGRRFPTDEHIQKEREKWREQ